MDCPEETFRYVLFWISRIWTINLLIFTMYVDEWVQKHDNEESTEHEG